MSPPWRRTPSLLLGCRAPPGAACSRPGGGGSLPRRGELAPAGEGLAALGFQRLLPGADEVLVEAEGACGLGDGVALLSDELDGLELEVRGVGTSRSGHDGPPQ